MRARLFASWFEVCFIILMLMLSGLLAVFDFKVMIISFTDRAVILMSVRSTLSSG